MDGADFRPVRRTRSRGACRQPRRCNLRSVSSLRGYAPMLSGPPIAPVTTAVAWSPAVNRVRWSARVSRSQRCPLSASSYSCASVQDCYLNVVYSIVGT